MIEIFQFFLGLYIIIEVLWRAIWIGVIAFFIVIVTLACLVGGLIILWAKFKERRNARIAKE